MSTVQACNAPSTQQFMKLVYGGLKTEDPSRHDDRCGEFIEAASSIVPASPEMHYVQIICNCLKISSYKLQTDHAYRKREYVYARQMHMLVRSKLLGMSLRVAGEIYGKDHATVLHAIRTQLNLYETDKAYRAQTADFWERYFKNEK